MGNNNVYAVAPTKELLRDKAWARWTALALLAFAMFCSYIFMDIQIGRAHV